MFQDDVEKALPPEGAQEDELVSIRAKGTTELNLQEVSFDPLHSSKNLRGRLVTSTEVISSSSVDVFKSFVPKITGRMMFDKASVFDLPGKLTPVEVGMKRDDAVPDINEVRKLFENKKPTNDESDDQVIDVRRHRNVYIEVGAFEESGAEKAETLFPDD